MDLTVHPGNPLQGMVRLPGDKSLSHRAALFASLAKGESCIENFLSAGVTQAMLNALASLGVSWELNHASLRVQGRGFSGWQAPLARLDCGNSATTLRLLAGALSASGLPAVLDGSPGLRRRPMARIVEPLQKMGVPVTAAPGGTAPLALSARTPKDTLEPLHHSLAVASAQVKSCLLLAALAARGPSTVSEPTLSRDHTERMLAAMGVSLATGRDGQGPTAGHTVTLQPLRSEELSPLRVSLPGDISSAAFLIVAALIVPGSKITLPEILLNPTRTGLLDVLQAMGAEIRIANPKVVGGEPVGDVIASSSRLHGVRVSGETVVRMIDEFPALAVAAAYAEGETEICDAQELRYKESDRIQTICRELSRLGAEVEESAAGFKVQGGSPLSGGRVEAYGDHRLAMALAVAGLAGGGPVRVSGSEVIAESFPDFEAVLGSLGAELHSGVRK